MPNIQIAELISQTEVKFKTLSDTPRLDAELLLIESLNICQNEKTYHRTYLRTWPDRSVDNQVLVLFKDFCQQRLIGKPIAYILGRQSFWSFELEVNEDTLIPRADTEIVVETALNYLPEHSTSKILDMGTGSGAIALAIASERPSTQVYATDIYFPTLKVAKQNKNKYQIDNLNFISSNWLSAFKPHQFDIIISNPPYIEENDPHLQDLKFEPMRALVSKHKGLEDCQTIISQAKYYLKNDGLLFLEHGYNQANDIKNLFKSEKFMKIKQVKDLANHIRVTLGQVSF